MKTTINVETHEAFEVRSNHDLTEGRGGEYPLYLTYYEATANRLAKGRYVQGLDCPILKTTLFIYEGRLYGPIDLHNPSESDMREEKRLIEQRELAAKKKVALEKAKALGLTEEEIALLKL